MKRKALLVGINKFKQIKGLRGCENDVANWHNLLKTFYGYTNNDIRVLTSERATRDNFLERLNWLQKDMGPGDMVVLQVSSHGTQVRDRDGDELKDGMDEVVCLHDMAWDNGFWSDDEMTMFIQSLDDNVNLEVIIDTCHSGTNQAYVPVPDAIDLLSAPINIGAEPASEGRYVEPPLDIQLRSEGEDLTTRKFVSGLIGLKWGSPDPLPVAPTVLDPNYVLWSACGEAQTAADARLGTKFNGAFSYYMCKHIRESQGQIDRDDLLKRVRASIKHKGFTQKPELTCSPNQAQRKFLT